MWMRDLPPVPDRMNPNSEPSGENRGNEGLSVAKVSWRGAPPTVGTVQS